MSYSVKITKNVLASGGSPRLIFMPNWITNGHWLIRRENVENEPLFRSEEVFRASSLWSKGAEIETKDDDELALRIVTPIERCREFVPLRRTEWIHRDDRGESRLYTGAGLLVAVGPDYEFAFGKKPGGIFTLCADQSTALAVRDFDDPGKVCAVLMPLQSLNSLPEGEWIDLSSRGADSRRAAIVKAFEVAHA